MAVDVQRPVEVTQKVERFVRVTDLRCARSRGCEDEEDGQAEEGWSVFEIESDMRKGFCAWCVRVCMNARFEQSVLCCAMLCCALGCACEQKGKQHFLSISIHLGRMALAVCSSNSDFGKVGILRTAARLIPSCMSSNTFLHPSLLISMVFAVLDHHKSAS